ncbi:hypothetical protein HYH02_003794 [Chlamydomonas schloesseri]|uniref:Uncharacterized protein n=1 Tax=Chlamydomonas schloesseri TaxID=2026947 RepID=A0A835WPN4_9CHLO|nr:hypothetical protein HYH02_003794 [Chlamydomonas schloesseri]|eukprot:KAG2451187.1 hypothetical protein HYH02_003794 [Chlamydomonas schloesseri]
MKLPNLEPEDLSHDFLEAFAARLTDSSGGQMNIACGAARRGCVIVVLDVLGPWQPQATLAAASGADTRSGAGAAEPSGMGAPAAQVLPPPLAALLSALPVQRQPGMRVVFRQPAVTAQPLAAAAGGSAAAQDQRLQREAGVVVEWVGPEQGWRVVPNAAVPALPAGAYGPGDVAAAADGGEPPLSTAVRQSGRGAEEAGHGLPLEGSLSLRLGPSGVTARSDMLGSTSGPQQQQQPRPPPLQPGMGYQLSQQHLQLHHHHLQRQQQQQHAVFRAQVPASLMLPAAVSAAAASAAAVTAADGLPDGSRASAGAAVSDAAAGLPAPSPPQSNEGRAARNSPPAHILCSLRGLHASAAAARSKGSEVDSVSGGQPFHSAAGSAEAIASSLAGQGEGPHSSSVAAARQLSAQHRARSFGGGSSAALALASGGFVSGPLSRRDSAANNVSSGGGGSVNSGGSNAMSSGCTRPQSLQVHKHSRAAPPLAGAAPAGSADSGSVGAGADAATAAAATAGSIFRRRARSASVPYGHPNGVRALLETHHEHGEDQPSPPPRRKRADTPAGPRSGPAASGQAPASADGAGAGGAHGSRSGAGSGAVASHGGAFGGGYGDECDIRTSDTAVRDVTRTTSAQVADAGAQAAPSTVGRALGARPPAPGGRVHWGRTASGGVADRRDAALGLRWSGAAAAMEANGGPPGQGGALAAVAASAPATAPAAGWDGARPAYAHTGSFMRPGALAAALAPAPDTVRSGGTFSSGLYPGYLQAQNPQSLPPSVASRQQQPHQLGSSVGSRMEWGAGNTDMDLLWSSPRPWAVLAAGARRGQLAQPGTGASSSTGPGGHRATPYVSPSSAAAAAMAAATALVAGNGAPQHLRQRSAARHLPVSAASGPTAAAAHELSSAGNVPPQALDTGFTEACAWLMQTQRQTPPQLAPPQPVSQSQLVLKDQKLQHSLRQQQSPRQQQPRQRIQQQRQRQQVRALRPDQAVREAQRMRLLWRGGSGEVPARAPSGASAASDDADVHMLDEALASLVAEYQHPHTDAAAPDAQAGAATVVATTASNAAGAPQPGVPGASGTRATAVAQGGAAGSAATAATAGAGGHGLKQPSGRRARPQLRLQQASEGEPELEVLLLGGRKEPPGTALTAATAEGDFAGHTVWASGSGAGHAHGPAAAPDHDVSVSAAASARNISGNWAAGVSVASMAAATAVANAAVAGAATASSGINSSATGGPTSSAVAVAPLGFAVAAAAAAVTASQSSGGPGTGAGAVVDTSMSIAAAVGASGLMSLSQPTAPFLKVRHPPAAAAAAAAVTDTASSTASAAALASGGGAAAEGAAAEAATAAAAAAPAPAPPPPPLPPVSEGAAKPAGAAAAGSATAQRRWSSPSGAAMQHRAKSNSPEQCERAAAAAAAAAGPGAEPATGTARLGSGSGSGSGSGRRPGGEPPGAHSQGHLQTYGTTAAYCDSFWATTIPEATGEGSLESSNGRQATARAAAGAADATGAATLPGAAATVAAAAAAALGKDATSGGLGAPVALAEAPPGGVQTSQGKAARVGGGGSVLRALSSGMTDEEDEDDFLAMGQGAEGASEGEEGAECTAEAAELVALLTRVSSGTIRRVALQALEGNWLAGSEVEEEEEERADEYVVMGEEEDGGLLVGPSSSRDGRSGGRWDAGRSGRSWSGRGPAPPSGHVTSAEGPWGTSVGGGLLGQPSRGMDQGLFAALPDASAPLQSTAAAPRPAQLAQAPPPLQRQQQQQQQQQQALMRLASPGVNREAALRASSYQLRRSAASYGGAAAADSAAMAHAVAAATGLDSIMIFTDADPWAHSPWDGSAAAAAAAGGPGGEAAIAAIMAAMGPPTLEPAALVPPPTPMACVSFTVSGLPPAWAAAHPPASTGDLGAGGGGVAASSWRRNSAMSALSNAVGGGPAGAAAAASGGAGGSYWGIMTTFVSPPGDEAVPAAVGGGSSGGGGGPDGSGGLLVAVRCAGRYLPVQWSWRQQRVGAAAGADCSAGAGMAPVLDLSVSGLMGQGLLVVEVWYGGVYFASLPAVVTYDPRLVDDLLGRPPPPRPHATAAGGSSSRNPRHGHSEHPHGDGGSGGGGSRARHRRRSSTTQTRAAAAAAAAGDAELAGGGAAAAARGPVPDDVMYDLGIWLQYVASTAPLSRREALAAAATAAAGGRGGPRAGAAASTGYTAALADAAAAAEAPAAVGDGSEQQRPRHHLPAAGTRGPAAEATRLNGDAPAAEWGQASAPSAASPAPAPRRRALMDTAATFNLLAATQTTIQVRGGGAAAAASSLVVADGRAGAGSSAAGGVTVSMAASPPDGTAGHGSDTSLLHAPILLHGHDDPDAMQAVLQPSDVLRYTTAPPEAGGLEPWLPRSGDTLGSSQIFSSSSVAAFAAAGARAFVPVLPSAPVAGLPIVAPVDAAAAVSAAFDVAPPRRAPVAPAAANTVVTSATNVAMSIPADFEAAVAAAASSAAAAGSTLCPDSTAFAVGGGSRTAAASAAAGTAAAATLAAMAEPLASLAPPDGTGGATATAAAAAVAAAGVLEATSSSSTMLLLEDTAPPSRRRICHDSAVDMTVPILPGSVDMSAAVAALQRGPAYGQQMQELAVGLLAWLVFAGRPVAAAVVLRGLMGHRALRFTELCDQVRSLGSPSGAAARGAGTAGAAAGLPGMGGGMGMGAAAADGGGFTATGYGGMGLLHLAVHSGRREMIEAVVGWSAALSPVSEAAAGGAGSRHAAAGLPPPAAAAAADRFVALRSDAAAGDGGDRGTALPASEWCELCAAGVGPLHLAAALVMPAATVAVAAAAAAPDGVAVEAAAAAATAAAAAVPGLEGVDVAGLETLVWLLRSFPETRALWGSARDAYGTTPGAILSYYLRSLPPASADTVRAALVPLVGPEPTWAPPPPTPQSLLLASELELGLEQQQQASQQTLPTPGGATELQPPTWARRLFEQQPQQYYVGAPAAAAAARAVGDGEPEAHGPAGVLAVARAVAEEAAELGAVPPALRLARIARLLAVLAAAALLRPRSPPAGTAAAATAEAGAPATATAAPATAAAAAAAVIAADARAEAIRVALAAEVRALLRGLVLQAAADPAPVALVAMVLLALLVVRVWDALSPPERR